VERPPVGDVWRYLNPCMLFNRHLGLRGDLDRRLAAGDQKAVSLKRMVEEVQRDAQSLIAPRALWQFFEAEGDGERLHFYASGGRRPLHSFEFDRQREHSGACLTDYVLPAKDGTRDHVVLFVVTAGPGIRAQAQEWSAAGDFLKSHALQALGLETAEACAEWLHQRIRNDWGFPDAPSTRLQDLFTSRYRGKRYSFGYPACPNIDDQRGLWQLLNPTDIGVQLTDGMMMDPEASVSGLVFHHPACEYFAVESHDQRVART
jgi:5-methyltetrahydrofolate--homocysteine methyltransferase